MAVTVLKSCFSLTICVFFLVSVAGQGTLNGKFEDQMKKRDERDDGVPVQNNRQGVQQPQAQVQPNQSPGESNRQPPLIQQQPVVQQNQQPMLQKSLKLSETPECAEDVKKYCRGDLSNNLAVLECLQNDLQKTDKISNDCEHVVWTYKKRMTSDLKFEVAAARVCGEDLKNIADCRDAATSSGKGFVVPCLIEYIDNVTNTQCREFLSRMESIVFSDYRLVYKFVDVCGSDIEKHSCGRIEDNDKPSVHEQGEVLSCLMAKVALLDGACKHEILRIAELQSTDFHNDRQLYFACRDDRERFCSKIMSGDGRIYKCLFQHKFNQEMSVKCRERLTERQKVQREDFKANHGLAQSCRADILSFKCLGESTTFKQARLSTILLCLENGAKSGKVLAPECVAELKLVRHSLMEDYQISPEIVSSCQSEIRDQCDGMKRQGRTIHCLMDLARPKKLGKDHPSTTIEISKECAKSLGMLLKEVNVREDFSVDPALQEACASSVNLKCSNIPAGKGRVIDCLMNFVGKPNALDPECEERLQEIQYFVSRDFTLTARFLGACKPELESVCKIKDPETLNVKDQSQALSCLYRNGKANKVGKLCFEEIRRVMSDRAKSVDLQPDIVTACMSDLTTICKDKKAKDEEMDCLEDNLEKLEEGCKEVVSKYVEEEDENPELSQIFVKSCESFWKANCPEAADTGKDEDGDSLMKCLIKLKNHPDMSVKCRAGVEHHQLITMKDYTFSHDFKEACKEEVRDHCPKAMKKMDVILCLSESVRNDTFLEEEHRVKKACRKQLKFELLQRGENINLDERLKNACSYDQDKFCKNITPGRAAVVECLKSHQKELQIQCRAVLFKREKEEADDPNVDYLLMQKCKKMIKKYCLNDMQSPSSIFVCLRKNKQEEDFDKGCYRVILERQRKRVEDVRLNPDLLKDCKADISLYCKQEMERAKNSNVDAEGIVLTCLRNVFSHKVQVGKLSESCYDHVKDLVKESVLDYVQDTKLANACKKEIKNSCASAAISDRDDTGDKGAVEECLKKLMMSSEVNRNKNPACFHEILRVIAENKVDVHVDPILFRICSVDIAHICKEVARGEGRQMSCLLAALEDKNTKLQTQCKKALLDRVNLWESAAKIAPPETLSEFAEQLTSSPSKNYFLAVLFAFVGIIFIGGLFCGRVTKRLARQVKDR